MGRMHVVLSRWFTDDLDTAPDPSVGAWWQALWRGCLNSGRLVSPASLPAKDACELQVMPSELWLYAADMEWARVM